MDNKLIDEMTAFVRLCAGYIKDGEEDRDGEPFDMSGDDAVDIVAEVVNIARELRTAIELEPAWRA